MLFMAEMHVSTSFWCFLERGVSTSASCLLPSSVTISPKQRFPWRCFRGAPLPVGVRVNRARSVLLLGSVVMSRFQPNRRGMLSRNVAICVEKTCWRRLVDFSLAASFFSVALSLPWRVAMAASESITPSGEQSASPMSPLGDDPGTPGRRDLSTWFSPRSVSSSTCMRASLESAKGLRFMWSTLVVSGLKAPLPSFWASRALVVSASSSLALIAFMR
mmetsp:Transcript_4130/g.11853  ORF Transcript_4130/g.11853 Transcript_4130/m.11853 type:complete len:218 (+) Transcript_4130:197-850(+)